MPSLAQIAQGLTRGYELELLSIGGGDSGSVCLGVLHLGPHSVSLELPEGNSIFDKSVLLKTLTFFSLSAL